MCIGKVQTWNLQQPADPGCSENQADHTLDANSETRNGRLNCVASMADLLASRFGSLSLGSAQAKGRASSVSAFTARPCSHQLFRSRVPLKVVAARVGGVEIPNNKHVEFSVRYIYGIGPTTARSVVAETGLEGKRIKDLSEEELTILRDEIDKYTIEGDLRRFNSMNIRRLKEIQCYRGKRHIANLPVRGQRTKTNARTRKGKAKTVAGKKK